MNALLADTHTILWYLFEPTRLSSAADSALTSMVAGGGEIRISVISIIEVLYLVEKYRLPVPAYDDLILSIHDPAIPVDLVPIDFEVAKALERIPRGIVPDMPDRIIAATALAHSMPLVTCDSKIRAVPQLQTIW